jgi:uncharacterized membrane protein YbhN (UPF0104 family)
MTRAHARAWFHAIVLVIGVVGLAFLLRHVGWEQTKELVRKIGVWFAVIAVIDLLGVMADAFGVHGFLRSHAKIGFWQVFGAQASGLAINRLTPGNSLGEPVKVTLLSRHVPTKDAISAIVMFNLTTAYIGIALIVIGVPLTALMLDLPHRIAVLVWIGMAVLLTGAIVLTIVLRRGAIGTLIDGIASLEVISKARAKKWRDQVADIDKRLRDLGGARASGMRRGLAGVLISRAFNSAGTIAVLYAADIPMTTSLVVATLSVGILVTWMSNIVPLGVGIADGTNYVLYGLLGASPEAGLVFTMVTRLRTIVLAMLGLCVMGIVYALDGAKPQGGQKRPKPGRTKRTRKRKPARSQARALARDLIQGRACPSPQFIPSPVIRRSAP